MFQVFGVLSSEGQGDLVKMEEKWNLLHYSGFRAQGCGEANPHNDPSYPTSFKVSGLGFKACRWL